MIKDAVILVTVHHDRRLPVMDGGSVEMSECVTVLADNTSCCWALFHVCVHVFFMMPLTVKTNLRLSKGEFAKQWVRRGGLHPSSSAAAVCLSSAKASLLLPLPARSYSCSSSTLQMDYSSRAPAKESSTGGFPTPLLTLKQQTSAATF